MVVGANRVTDNSAARTKRGNRWAAREKGCQAEVGPVECYDNERGAPRVTPSVDRGLGIGDWGFDGSVRTSLTPHSSLLTPPPPIPCGSGIGDWALGIGGSMVLSERPSLLTHHPPPPISGSRG